MFCTTRMAVTVQRGRHPAADKGFTMNHQHDGQDSPPNFWKSRYAIGLVVIGGVAAYFLLTEHLAHVIAALPYLLLLACPLMHLFMHGGHSGHGEHGSHCHHDPSKPGSSKPTESRKPGDPS